MRSFNAAADWLAGEAFRRKTANKVELQQLYYHQLRDDFGISAQMAIRCIAQVCEAYSRDKSIRPRFRKYASIECGYFNHADIVGAKNIRSGALVIAREVSVAAESRVSRETSSIYNRGASA
jgi:predicted transposase